MSRPYPTQSGPTTPDFEAMRAAEARRRRRRLRNLDTALRDHLSITAPKARSPLWSPPK